MLIRNITLLGHKDHGKSTFIGSMLIQTKSILPAKIDEAKKISKKLKRPFEPGFILDSFHEEREGGLTIESARAEVTYKRQVFVFIDVPGHEELIKNMISGASSGEVAVLIVSAKPDEGIRDQTKRHLYIAKMMGIEKLVVAVNKIDLVDYNQLKFNAIKDELLPFIERIGFKLPNVYFVPISAYTGENLITKSSKMGWYKGDTVMNYLCQNSECKIDTSGPLRIMVQGLLDPKSGIILGNIVKGSVKIGDKIEIVPGFFKASVEELSVKGEKVKTAIIGENVAVKLDKLVTFDVRGTIISGTAELPELGKELSARIFVTDKIDKNLRIGFNGTEIPCKVSKIRDYIDTTNGLPSGKKSVTLLNAIQATLLLETEIPFEAFRKTNSLGRFVLHNDKGFAGIGIIEK